MGVLMRIKAGISPGVVNMGFGGTRGMGLKWLVVTMSVIDGVCVCVWGGGVCYSMLTNVLVESKRHDCRAITPQFMLMRLLNINGAFGF